MVESFNTYIFGNTIDPISPVSSHFDQLALCRDLCTPCIISRRDVSGPKYSVKSSRPTQAKAKYTKKHLFQKHQNGKRPRNQETKRGDQKGEGDDQETGGGEQEEDGQTGCGRKFKQKAKWKVIDDAKVTNLEPGKMTEHRLK